MQSKARLSGTKAERYQGVIQNEPIMA